MSDELGRGQPPHEPTDHNREIVTKMTQYGVHQDTISKCLDISLPTLYKYYRREIDTAKANCIVKVADRLMNKINNDDGPSIMFYLKTQAGWRERDKENDIEKEEKEKQERIDERVKEMLANDAK